MLRILIFNTLYYPYKIGGAEISVKNLAEQLAKDASVRVGVITIGEKDDCFILNNVNKTNPLFRMDGVYVNPILGHFLFLQCLGLLLERYGFLHGVPFLCFLPHLIQQVDLLAIFSVKICSIKLYNLVITDLCLLGLLGLLYC